MKMTKAQYEVWERAVEKVGKNYNDLYYFLDCLIIVDKFLNKHYYTKPWFVDVFPEYAMDTRRFIRVWLGDEPIEVEDKYEN